MVHMLLFFAFASSFSSAIVNQFSIAYVTLRYVVFVRGFVRVVVLVGHWFVS